MQYIAPITTSQAVMFTKPVEYDASTPLKFIGYAANFEVVPSVTDYHNFIKVSFTLTSEQAEYFESNSEFKVSFGNATDDVVGNYKPVTVIQYDE